MSLDDLKFFDELNESFYAELKRICRQLSISKGDPREAKEINESQDIEAAVPLLKPYLEQHFEELLIDDETAPYKFQFLTNDAELPNYAQIMVRLSSKSGTPAGGTFYAVASVSRKAATKFEIRFF